jgi:hypothetical protein
MRRDGFVIITNVLNPEQLALMQRTTHEAVARICDSSGDGGRTGNRQTYRWSFGTAFMQGMIAAPASLAGWHALVDL